MKNKLKRFISDIKEVFRFIKTLHAKKSSLIVDYSNLEPLLKSNLPKKGEVFKLTPLEVWRGQQFQKEHKCKRNIYKTPQFNYIFTHTGIGTGKAIQCENCGKICDITDYSCW